MALAEDRAPTRARRTYPVVNGGLGTHRLSVIVPCFNEEAVLTELSRRLVKVCSAEVGDGYEIILVNDGSKDGTRALIQQFVGRDSRFVGVNLARNYGHQIALTAGLDLCRGERALVIDADLQDPPELLGEMMRLMDAGANVVYGQRRGREGEGLFKRVTARVFYRTLSWLADVPIPVDTGDFRLMDRKVLDALRRMPERSRFVRGMVAWIGLKQVAFPYTRDPRVAGTTKYPLRRMVRLAVDAITGFSVRPLRLSLYVAMCLVILAVLLSAYVVYAWWTLDVVKGWSSTLVLFLLFGAAQLIVLGIIGEYLGRIYIATQQRPLYVIDEIVAAQPANDASSELVGAREPMHEDPQVR